MVAVAEALFVASVALAWGGPMRLLGQGGTPPGVLLVATAVYAVVLGAWARGSRWAGLVAFVLLACAGELEQAEAGGLSRSRLLPTVALGVRVLAGREAACGIVAAAYVLAGIAKLRGDGLSWFAPDTVGLLLRERVGAGPLEPLRAAVVAVPYVGSVLATAAVAIELGGVAFLWPRTRRTFAALAVAMHLGILLLMDIVYVEWIALVLALAACGPGAVPTWAREAAAAPRG